MLIDPHSNPDVVDRRLAELQDPQFAKRLLAENPELFSPPRRSGTKPLAVALLMLVALVAGYIVEQRTFVHAVPAKTQAHRAASDASIKRIRAMEAEIARVRAIANESRLRAARAEADAAVAERAQQLELTRAAHAQAVAQTQTVARAQSLAQAKAVAQAQSQAEQKTWLAVEAQVQVRAREKAARDAAVAANVAAATTPVVPAAPPSTSGNDGATTTGPAPQTGPPSMPHGRCGHGHGVGGGGGVIGSIFSSVFRHVTSGGHF